MTHPLRLLTITLLGFGMACTAQAGVDPACAAIPQALIARSKAPAEETFTLIKAMDLKIEMVRLGGKSYTRISSGGKMAKPWADALEDHDVAERTQAEQMNSGEITLSNCRNEADVTIDGVATRVISFRLLAPGQPTAAARLHVGKADGLPYLQVVGDTETRSRYKNVRMPRLGT